MHGLLRAALLASTALTVAAYPAPAGAQTATWSTTPANGNYGNAANWDGGAVPNNWTATAVFGSSTQNNLVITSGSTYAVDGWTFNASAPNYTFDISNGITLGFWGAGITNNGTSTVAITNGSNGILTFYGTSTAGSAVITNNNSLYFQNTSTAGNAAITNNISLYFNDDSTAGGAAIANDGFLYFYGTSTAGNAVITNTNGVFFNDDSTAGSATITNDHYLYFNGTSTAGNAAIANNGNVYFLSDSTAHNASITNTGYLRFHDTSTAGSASITNSSTLSFGDHSTAGDATIANYGILSFYDNGTAGNAAITNNGGGLVDFSNSTGPSGDGKLSAGSIAGAGSFILGANELTVGSNNLSTEVSGVISGIGGSLVKTGGGTLTLTGDNTYTGGTTINGGTLQLGTADNAGTILGTVSVGAGSTFDIVNTTGISGIANGGTTYFRDGTSAGGVAITNNGSLYFEDNSTAGNATILNLAGLYFNGHNSTAGDANIANYGVLSFYDNSTGGSATITNRALLSFGSHGTAGGATITNFGVLNFNDDSTAGNAAITNNGGHLNFKGDSTAGSATITNSAYLDFFNNSTAGDAAITNDDALYFHDNSTAGGASITNYPGGTVDFSGTTGYSGDGKISAGSIAGAGNYILGGNELTVGSNNLSTEVSGVISGVGGALVKTGTGTMTLSGVNTYTGGTAINAGTLQLGNGGATGSILGNVLNNGALTFKRSDAFTFAGNISGSGAVSQIGSGTTILTGTNTYSGGTTINAGTLQLGDSSTRGTITGTVTVGTDGTFEVVNADTGAITGINNGGIIYFRDGTSASGAGITNDGFLYFNGTSTAGSASIANDNFLYFNDNSTAGSADINNGGVLSFSGHSTADDASITNTGLLAFYNNSTAGNAAITNNNGGTVDFSNGVGPSSDGKISAGSIAGAGNYVLGANELTVGSNNLSTEVSGVISGAGGALVKTGTGTLTLSGGNTYTGGTTINRGTLQLGNATDAGAIAGTVVVGFSGTFDVVNADTSGITDIRNIGITSFRDGASAGSATYANYGWLNFRDSSSAGSAAITNDGVVYFYNTSTADSAVITNNNYLDFNGSSTGGNAAITNNYELYFRDSSAGGSAAITNNYALRFYDNSTAGSATITNNSGGTVDFSNSTGPNNDRKLSAGSIAGAGDYILGANELTVGSNDLSTEVSGVISGAGGALVKTGTGTLTLSGSNTYTGGTTISGGTLQLGNGGATGSISGNVVNNGILAFDRSDISTFSGVISGTGAVQQVDSGTTILTGSNTYGGGTAISAGRLQLGDGGTTGSISGNVVNDGVLAFNRSNAMTLAGNISGSGAVQQIGTGTTILTGSNSYNGNTLVSSGRLQFGDGSAGGANNLGGNLMVTGGTLAIQTPATVNVVQTVTFGDNTALSITAGANSPALSAGSVAIGLDVALSINGIDNASQLDKVLIDTTSGISGDFASVTVGGFSGTADYLTVSTRKSADSRQYLASYGLSWFAGNDLAHGSFTLTDASDSFTVGTLLADQAANPVTGWNGTSLTKAGAGTLILTGDNTYNGGTRISAGTLQLGDGGATGSISGNVVNGGVLAFNRSDVATFAGNISGNGAVRQIGAGTTILIGDNTYSGGTTIASGTLQLGNGGATGSISGNVVNGGVLAFNRSDISTFSGAISGTGTVRQIGSGTTILTGGNTYSGGTTIVGGTLQLGNGGTTGAISGDVVNDGVLAFNRSNNVTFAGAISGSGAVQQIGSGTTILTGGNTYSGGTTIAGGTLQLGNGGATGSISGDVVNNGVLAFNRTGTLTLAGAISGSGAVQQIGSGTTILTGANSYSGDTTVSGGRLQFGDGSAGANNILGGSLTVTGGTLAIQTPTTLDVAQAVTLADHTALSILAGNGPALSAHRVAIGNNVTINIGGIDDVSQTDKVLIDTHSGISGDFATVSVGGSGEAVDYLTVSTRKSDDGLQYLASYGLTWLSGNNLANGTFTLTDAADSFTVGTVLADQAANPATGWDGTSLTKAGAGTLTLTGINTYTGGTTISGGVLSVSRDANLGAATGGLTFTGGTLATTASFDTTRSVSLTQAGRFELASGTELGLTGVISGSGDLVKSGAGTLRLDNGANAYGNTLVAAGTLVGNAASISGNIANAGTVVFNQGADASFGGDIGALNGTRGAMTKRGAGALTLTGMSSLDWTIETGGLVASAERFGGNAAIALGASFTFDQSANATYAGVLSGTGGFNKTGAGLLGLTGVSSGFTGATTVAGGTLAVNGRLGGTLDVLAAGRLQGIGTVGNSIVSGTIAPGNSIGTLNVAGNITFNSGSTYEVEVNAQGDSDKIIASGKATINGGTVKVLAGAGNNAPQTQYTIVTADLASGGVVGTFNSVTSNLAFLDPSLSYDANNVYLTMTRNDVGFNNVGLTPNQIATGSGAESLGFGNPVYNALLNLSAPQAQYAFDQLSGEIHASARTALIEDSRFIRNAVNDRIRAAFDGVGASKGGVVTYVDGKPIPVSATTDGLAVWGQGFGSWGHTDSDGNAARLNRKTDGFFVSADAPVFDTWRFGAVAGYSRTDFDVKSRRSSGSSDNYHLGLYGGTQWGDLAFRTGAAYTWHDVSTSRTVSFAGFGNSLKGDYNAATAQIFGELAYGFNVDGARFEPFANLAYVNLHTDRFTETGGTAALTSPAGNTDATFTTLGLRASTTFDIGGATLTARGMLGWRHAFGDVTPFSTMRFAAGGNAFSIGGVPIARNAAVIEAGLDYAITPNATLGVSYGGQFGSGMSDQTARFNFNVKF